MPLQYRGILYETKAVRTKGGIFDVSHMGRVYITGSQATQLMEWIQTGPISSLKESRAKYSLICNEEGGIIDDTVTYRLEPNRYLLVCNASNRVAVLNWIGYWKSQKFPETYIDDVTLQTVMIAVQGPQTPQLMEKLCGIKSADVKFFSSVEGETNGLKLFIGRTGYTGEDGFEVITNADYGPRLWEILLENGMTPCGLGSRDVLRLEAGLALHGSDIDQSTSPLEAGLHRFVDLGKEFLGATVLKKQQDEGIKRRLVGMVAEGRNIPRHDYRIVVDDIEVGRITSGSYSPTLDTNIAMGYVSVQHSGEGGYVGVEVRDKIITTKVIKLPFYKRRGNQ